MTYDGYTVITEAQSTADEKNIVGALHDGEGNIVLPVQSLIAQPPPSINTADMSVCVFHPSCFTRHGLPSAPSQWQSYVCNASSPEEAVDVLISRPNSTFYFFEQCASACSGINNSFAVDGCVGVSVSPNTSVQSADIARTYLNDIDVIFSTALGDLVSVNVHQPLLLEVSDVLVSMHVYNP